MKFMDKVRAADRWTCWLVTGPLGKGPVRRSKVPGKETAGWMISTTVIKYEGWLDAS